MKHCKIGKALLYNGDCLKVMSKLIKQGVKVDAIITDPPYGGYKTRAKWDKVIPLPLMWKKLYGLCKFSGGIILFGNEPFSSHVRLSNLSDYKYDYKWVKNKTVGFANANYRPMNKYEDIMVFSRANASSGGKQNCMYYKPQNLIPVNKVCKNTAKRHGLVMKDSNNTGKNNSLLQDNTTYIQKFTGYPNNILYFDCAKKYVHPTQKPVALIEYLIQTYTKKGDTVLDFTMGSGTTGVACKHLNRKFIGIELEEDYYKIAKKRIKEE